VGKHCFRTTVRGEGATFGNAVATTATTATTYIDTTTAAAAARVFFVIRQAPFISGQRVDQRFKISEPLLLILDNFL